MTRTTSSLRSGTRRALLSLAVPLLALPLVPGAALAQDYPSKPITLIVPFPPGGPTDVASRIIGQKLEEGLGQPIVVDNRAGASGTIGAGLAARAKPDGYTLLMLATPTLLADHLYARVNYKLFEDFDPVGNVYDLPIVLVVNPKALPDVKTLQDLVEKAKAEKGKLNYTTAGVGSFGHLTTEMLKKLAGFDMLHVAYRGSAPAVTDLLGGQVPIMFSDLIAVLPHIQSGALHALAVGTAKGVSLLPDVKSIADQGFPGFDATSWGAMLAPKGTPKEIVARLSEELKKALADEEVQKKLEGVGTFAAWQSPEQLAERMRADHERWGQVIRENNITRD